MPYQESYTERGLARAAERSEAEAFVFVRDAGTERLSCAELGRQAKDFASWPQHSGLSGRQILLPHPRTRPL
ncbi:hypothetical protein ACH4TX_44065 [Streptomyces sp. NPDC021098]|uniref:hypothetical protein n=1 Tax=unclassified Streptomyces TaxID=2593676 RepID=UPI0037BD280E